MKEIKWFHELFEETCELKERSDRIKFLRDNAYAQVVTLLAIAYNDNINLALPKSKPPFKTFEKLETTCTDVYMKNLFSRIGICEVRVSAKEIEKEKAFISILESIPLESAEILIAAHCNNILTLKNKKYSKITKSLVEAALPEVFKLK